LKSDKKINTDLEFVQSSMERLSGIDPYLNSLKNVLNVVILKYLNEPGKSSDLKGFYYASHTYSRIYQSFINWAIDTLSVSVSERQLELKNLLAEITAKLIAEIWDYPFRLNADVLEIKKKIQAGETLERKIGTLQLEIDRALLTKITTAIQQFSTTMTNFT